MENLEILKDILSPEIYAQLEKETADSKLKLADLSSGKYVSEEKYKGLETQLEKVNTALANKAKEYDALKEKAGDNETLKNTIEQMKAEHQTALDTLKNDYNKEIKKSAVTARIVSDYHPKDVSDILPHVDMSKVTVDNDTITGLKEQIDPLLESKAYLFGEEQKRKSGLDHSGDTEDALLERIRASAGLKTKEKN